MNFVDVENEFKRLKRDFDKGVLTKDKYLAQLEDLKIQDEHGKWWIVGSETGQWHYHDGETWVPGDPPGRSAAVETSPAGGVLSKLRGLSRRGWWATVWLVLVLAGSVLGGVAMINGLQHGWYPDADFFFAGFVIALIVTIASARKIWTSRRK